MMVMRALAAAVDLEFVCEVEVVAVTVTVSKYCCCAVRQAMKTGRLYRYIVGSDLNLKRYSRLIFME